MIKGWDLLLRLDLSIQKVTFHTQPQLITQRSSYEFGNNSLCTGLSPYIFIMVLYVDT